MFFRWNGATVSDRKNLYICVLRECVFKAHDPPARPDYVDLRMRDAARFDDVFDRRFFDEPSLDNSAGRF